MSFGHRYLLFVALITGFSCETLFSTPSNDLSVEEKLWEEAVNANIEQAGKTYATYQKLLSDACLRVAKTLEANIKDLNDLNKFPKLDVKERARAVTALEEKIRDLKENDALADEIVGRFSYGANDLSKLIIGHWEWAVPSGGVRAKVVFRQDGTIQNPWSEPWTYEVSANKVKMHLNGSSNPNKEIVYIYRGNGDRFADRQRTTSLTRVDDPRPFKPNALYYFSTAFQGEEKVLGVAPDGPADQVALTRKQNTANHCWKITPLGEGYYRLTSPARGDGLSLDVENDGIGNNKLRLYKTGNFSGQAWKITPEPGRDGYYRLTTNMRGDGFSLDVINEGENTKSLILAPSGNYSGQNWRLTEAK